MRAASILLLLSLAIPSSLAGSGIEGEWVLVDQVYGTGSNNLADAERPLHLEFTRGVGGLQGLLWAGDDRGAAVAWPSFAPERHLAPVEVLERRDDPGHGTASVRYRVEIEPERGFLLDVTESYRVDDDDRLAAEVTVRFVTPEGDRGSYVLSRQFERAR